MQKADVNVLVISYIFPPITGISGIVICKRIINNKSTVDVIYNTINEDFKSYNFNQVDDYINDRIELAIDAKHDTIECIFNFIEQGIEQIENKKEYENIYSRSFMMANHYLALEYKFRHPDVFWRAEISDPILRNLYTGKPKNPKTARLNNQEYIDKLNREISKLNEAKDANFKLLENPNNTFYIAEYMTLLFSDEIIFTNVNQREIMLEYYDDDVRQIVYEKSIISPHPTLSDEFYHLEESDVQLNDDDINIAYFGSYYYSLRHFEPLFYALDSLNHKYKDKIKFHLYISDDEFIKALIRDLECTENIITKEPLDYFEFLNATTKYDILLINDTITEGNFSINPYLPSKLSDYKGSGKDIWGLYEKGSILSTLDLKYKSSMTEYLESCNVLIDILNDYGYEDPDATFDEHHFERRITELNKVSKREFDKKIKLREKNADLRAQIKQLKKDKQKLNKDKENLKNKNQQLQDKNKELKGQIKDLKGELNEILSSHSWKITKPLRDIKNFRK